MAEIAQSLIIIFLESVCCKFFLDTFMQKKDYLNKWMKKIMLAVMVLSFTIIAILVRNFALKSCLIVLIIMIFVQIYYNATIFQSLVLSAIYYGILLGIDYLSIVIIKNLLPERYYEILYGSSVSATIVILFCKMVLFLTVLMIRQKWKEKDGLDLISNMEWIYLSYFPLFTIASMAVMLFGFDFSNESLNINILLILAFGLVIMNFIVFYVIHDIVNREKIIRNSRLMQERTKNQMNIYWNMHHTYEQQRKRTHDYKNQLNCIQGMLANGRIEETQEYIADLTGSLIKDLDTIHTNHAVADAVLNQKYRYAQSKEITMILVVNDLSELIINEENLVTVLSNILDNAIEACEKVEGDRVIKFKMIIEKGQLLISVQNPLKKPLDIVANKIVTSKADKIEHGIGLLNIKAVVDKYDGIFAINNKEGWFCLSVLIPLKQC